MYHLTLPKSLVFVRGVSSPHLSFSHEGSAGRRKAVGRQAGPRGQSAHPAGSGRAQGQGAQPGPRTRCCSAPPVSGPPSAPPDTRGTWCLFAFIFHFWFEWVLLSFFLVLF